jgi:hypothetical protein
MRITERDGGCSEFNIDTFLSRPNSIFVTRQHYCLDTGTSLRWMPDVAWSAGLSAIARRLVSLPRGSTYPGPATRDAMPLAVAGDDANP